jgi:ABC-type polysaccharide/polyol phosphate export permease
MNQSSHSLEHTVITPQTTLWGKIPSAWRDFLQAFLMWRVWGLLGWHDIRLRYRRSVLGPFLITISMAVTIYTIGFLYSYLMKTDMRAYYPFLAAGLLIWNFVTLLLNEGTSVFIESQSYLKQIKMPYIVFVLRLIARNFIIFCHNLVVMIPIVLFFHLPVNWHTLLFFVGVLIFLGSAISLCTLVAVIGLRYRDVQQIITNLIQVTFFLSPILWQPSIIPEKYQHWVYWNPVTHYLAIMRSPLLGEAPSLMSYQVTIGLMVLGFLGVFLLFSRVRARLVYWL